MAKSFENSGLKSSQKARLISRDPSMFYSTGAGNKLLPQDGLLGPLKETNGVVFPYTPSIQVAHAANYGTYDITHSVYQSQYYINTANPNIGLFTTFTAQSQEEAIYMAASLHFFKSCTKSDFGDVNRAGADGGLGTAGTPPPVLLFTAYGNIHFKNVPVVIRSVSYTMPEDVDYITFKYTRDTISMPTQMLISLDLGVQMAPTKQREFDLQRYRHGIALGRKSTGFL